VVVALLLLSVALLTLYFRESGSGVSHRVQEVVLEVVTPLQTGTARATKPFRDGWHWVVDLFRAKSENAALRREVEQLRAGLANKLLVEAENAELRRLVGLRDDLVYPKGVRFVTGRVVARSTSAWYSTVTINVGSADGVRRYDPVVNGAGLVGRVMQVTRDAAQVMLITDQQSYIDAVVEPGGAQGLVAGSVTGDLSLQYVGKDEKVKVGQYVVSAGRASTVFVRGIPIGVVESVSSREVELYQTIAVRPFVDFGRLDLVQVIVR